MDLNRVDLNLLVAFEALMSERSVTRAAQRLCIGQSAMSSTLGRLRELLDDPLLVRSGRGLIATPLAESLEGPVREALERVQSVLSIGRAFDPAHDERTFRVITSDYVAMTLLPPLLSRLEREAPRVRLQVRPATDGWDEQLKRNRVDLAVMPREVFPSYSEYGHQVLFRDHWVCAVDAAHPDVGEELTLEALADLPYLAASFGSLPSFVELQLDLLGIERRTELTAGLGVTPFMLRGTRLVTLLPRLLAERVAPLAGLKLLVPPVTLAPIHETLLWSKRGDLDPGQRWLQQCLVELAAGFAAAGQ